MSCGHSVNTHPSFEKGLLKRKEPKGCDPRQLFFLSVPPPPGSQTPGRPSLNRTPGTPHRLRTVSPQAPRLGPPTSPGGLDLEMTEGPSSTPGSPAGLGCVCSSEASSLAAFPEIQFSFLLGPAHSWPQKAGFSNQPWEKRSAFIMAPSE